MNYPSYANYTHGQFQNIPAVGQSAFPFYPFGPFPGPYTHQPSSSRLQVLAPKPPQQAPDFIETVTKIRNQLYEMAQLMSL